MKSRYTILIGVLLSLVILALLLARVDLARVREAFAGARYVYVIPAALTLAVSMLTRAVRWRALLDGHLPLRQAFPILGISYLFNGVLPFRLGEVVRIFLANRAEQRLPVFTTLSTIVVERLLDMLAVIGILGIVLALLDVPGYVASAGMMLGGAAAAGIVILFLMARYPGVVRGLVARLEGWLPVMRRWNLAGMAARFLEGLAPLTRWRSALLAVSWSVLSWGLSVAAGYVLMYAFFPQASWLTTMLFIALASLAVSVPYAPGAVGPYEAGVVMALSWTGYDSPEGAAVAFAIVLHAMTTGVFVVLGVYGLVQQGVTLGQVMQGARAVGPVNGSGLDPAAHTPPVE